MSSIIEPENEDFNDYSDDYIYDSDYEPYIVNNKDNEDSMLKLDKWIYLYNLNANTDKFSCNMLLPNPNILGLEKSYEICNFLITEIESLVKEHKNSYRHRSLNYVLLNCKYLLDDFLHYRLKLK